MSQRGETAGSKAGSLALRFISGKYQGGEFPLHDNQSVTVGRSSDLDMVLVEELIQGVAVIVFLYAVGTCLHRYQDVTAFAAPPPPQPGERGRRRSVVTAFRGPRPHGG